MKQQDHTKTAELPGIPVAKKRGRPALNGEAMTAAERKKKSRRELFQKNIQAENGLRALVQLNATVCSSVRTRLNKIAEARKCTIGDVIEQLLEKAEDEKWI